jgi:hypothetical protein
VSTAKWKLALGLGVGLGSIAILVVCGTIGLTIRKLRKSPRASAGFAKSSRLFSLMTASGPGTGPAEPEMAPAKVLTPYASQALHTGPESGGGGLASLKDTLAGLPTLRTSHASAISTARDLLSDTYGVFGSEQDVEGPSVPQSFPSSREGGASTSRHSGKTDSAHTMHREHQSRADIAASVKAVRDESDELWTRGVDPADVEIRKGHARTASGAGARCVRRGVPRALAGDDGGRESNAVQ